MHVTICAAFCITQASCTTLAACGGHVAKQPSDGALCRLMQIIINTIDTSGLHYARNQLDPYCRYDRTAEL